jgi:hypothetical protein
LHDQLGLAVEWCECCYEVVDGHLLGWVLLGSRDSQNDQGGRDDKKAENF